MLRVLSREETRAWKLELYEETIAQLNSNKNKMWRKGFIYAATVFGKFHVREIEILESLVKNYDLRVIPLQEMTKHIDSILDEFSFK